MAFGIDLSDVNRRLDNTEKEMVAMREALHEVIALLGRTNELLAEIANKN